MRTLVFVGLVLMLATPPSAAQDYDDVCIAGSARFDDGASTAPSAYPEFRVEAATGPTSSDLVCAAASGVFEGLCDGVLGLAQMITDPAAAAKSLWRVATDPGQVATAVSGWWGELMEARASDPVRFARMLGRGGVEAMMAASGVYGLARGGMALAGRLASRSRRLAAAAGREAEVASTAALEAATTARTQAAVRNLDLGRFTLTDGSKLTAAEHARIVERLETLGYSKSEVLGRFESLWDTKLRLQAQERSLAKRIAQAGDTDETLVASLSKEKDLVHRRFQDVQAEWQAVDRAGAVLLQVRRELAR